MANLHNAFTIFHDRITLDRNKKMVLRIARDVIRGRIRTYFREALNVQPPDFKSQDAWAMDTMINPIDGEYAIDDGVYLQHLDKQNGSAWPPATAVHQWICNATGNFVDAKPQDTPTCVRLRCAGQYHVDLPCYGILNGRCLLAIKDRKQWSFCDPMALSHWFQCHVYLRGGQLQRIVRYFKAWADFQSRPRRPMLPGLILTVLVTNCFHSHARDDIAFAQTLKAVVKATEGIVFILNPVDLSDELTACLTDKQKKQFHKRVQTTAFDADKAIRMYDFSAACRLWQKHLGHRFPFEQERSIQVSEKNHLFTTPGTIASQPTYLTNDIHLEMPMLKGSFLKLNGFHQDFGRALPQKAKSFCSPGAEVDDTAFDKRTTVVDPNDNPAFVS